MLVKVDCGYLGTTESSCIADGCMWCPSNTEGDPWCIHKEEFKLRLIKLKKSKIIRI